VPLSAPPPFHRLSPTENELGRKSKKSDAILSDTQNEMVKNNL